MGRLKQDATGYVFVCRFCRTELETEEFTVDGAYKASERAGWTKQWRKSKLVFACDTCKRASDVRLDGEGDEDVPSDEDE